MRYLLIIGLCALGCDTPSAPKAPEPVVTKQKQSPKKLTILDELSIPTLNEWTDRYADGKKGDVRFFNITRLMNKFGLSRLQAVELQNQYRDLTRAAPETSRVDALQTALDAVKKGELESGVDAQALAKAKFTIVFDLDDTLYDQYYPGGETCHGVAFKRQNGKMKYIQPIPGWTEAIKRIVALGGKVVLFSANLDETTLENLAQMKIDDVPLTQSPLISGIMTNSHLTQQEKTEPPGSRLTPRKGRPVIEPSKDLRHFDPSLERVIIVDDNPLRLFQYRNTRLFKKFHADDWCTTKDEVKKAAYDRAMLTVVKEIEESLAYMEANRDVNFATAYLPYSYLGRVAVQFVMDGKNWTRAQANAYVRTHPDVVDARF
ncbi:MAG: NIF family HAD-type phosphatase [Myxococcota bacterium]|nr:NIF family HAD-type phosphatase [Myxococcota bacterium]